MTKKRSKLFVLIGNYGDKSKVGLEKLQGPNLILTFRKSAALSKILRGTSKFISKITEEAAKRK